MLRALGVVHLLGLAAFAGLFLGKGDPSTCAHPVIRCQDAPPCPECGQVVQW